MTQIPNQRHLFDIPDDVAYFNTATMGPMTKAAVEAGQKGLARKLHPWTIPDTEFFADTERLRPLLAELIGADTDGIAFSPSVSYSLATAARNLPLSIMIHMGRRARSGWSHRLAVRPAGQKYTGWQARRHFQSIFAASPFINVLELVFASDLLRPKLINWEEIADATVRHVRYETGLASENPAFRAVLERVSTMPGFASRWTSIASGSWHLVTCVECPCQWVDQYLTLVATG